MPFEQYSISYICILHTSNKTKNKTYVQAPYSVHRSS